VNCRRRFEHNESFQESLWWSLLATLDPVKFADETTPMTRLVGFISSFLGLVIVASLIGLVNNSIDARIDALKKGKSPVVCSDHTLIVNFNKNRVLSIIDQFIGVDHSAGVARTIVVLSSENKLEVEEMIAHHIHVQHSIDVVVRQGDTGDARVLAAAGAARAAKIVILNPHLTTELEASAVEDMPVIRPLLALRHLPHKCHSIVAEVSASERVPLLMHIGGPDLCCMVMNDVLSRLIVRTARFEHVGKVYELILDESEGHENVDISCHSIAQLDGMQFGVVQPRLRNAIALGYERTVNGVKSQCIAPAADVTLRADDRLIILGRSGVEPEFVAAARAIDTNHVEVSGSGLCWQVNEHNA
jgi:Trk K+ transport system NAD-binding subunit